MVVLVDLDFLELVQASFVCELSLWARTMSLRRFHSTQHPAAPGPCFKGSGRGLKGIETKLMN